MRLSRKLTRILIWIGYRFLKEEVAVVAQQMVGIDNGTTMELSGEEFVVQKIISKNIKDKAILDIGCNTGGYSVMLSKYFATEQIIAFDPNPNCIPGFKSNTDVRFINVAIAENVGLMPFYVDKANNTSPHASLIKPKHNRTELKTVEVKVERLDSLISSESISLPGFVKVDAEGNDLSAIKSLGEYLNKIDFIQFEFNAMHVDSRVFLRDYYQFLSEFKLYRLAEKKLIDISEYSPNYEIFRFQNVLAINKELNLNIQPFL